MDRKKRIILLSILTILVIIINYYLLLPKKIVFSDDPKQWVEKKGDIKELKLDQISQGRNYIDTMGQQFNDINKGIRTSFDLEGSYKGKKFRVEYLDKQTNKTIMKITNNMNPEDGIIEGYIVEVIKEEPEVYIFLDNDWKENVGETNIFWGVGFGQNKTFIFNEINQGIFMDKIIDDKNRFLNKEYTMAMYGIIVGDLTRENNINKTIIKLI